MAVCKYACVWLSSMQASSHNCLFSLSRPVINANIYQYLISHFYFKRFFLSLFCSFFDNSIWPMRKGLTSQNGFGLEWFFSELVDSRHFNTVFNSIVTNTLQIFSTIFFRWWLIFYETTHRILMKGFEIEFKREWTFQKRVTSAFEFFIIIGRFFSFFFHLDFQKKLSVIEKVTVGRRKFHDMLKWKTYLYKKKLLYKKHWKSKFLSNNFYKYFLQKISNFQFHLKNFLLNFQNCRFIRKNTNWKMSCSSSLHNIKYHVLTTIVITTSTMKWERKKN